MTWKCSSCEHQNLGRHKTCQQCGDPKDKSEKYEMPKDTAGAQSVTDAGLVKMAVAGANWVCPYCGSNQRTVDNACGQCGAAIDLTERVQSGDPPLLALTRWAAFLAWVKKHRVILGIAGAVVVLGVSWYVWSHRTRTYSAQVADVAWTHTISVERYQIWTREGWRAEQPGAAFDVVSLGDKIHHYDKVQDGYETQYYTERVACGEDCYDEPERCSEHCSDNGNGFASCTTRCTGGGRKCSTKYCSEQRSRQVPRYIDVARYQESIRYRIWDWGQHRQVVAQGHGITGLRWPVEEAKVGQGLGEGEKERETRVPRYVVTLGYKDGKLAFEVPEQDLTNFPDGSGHQLVIKKGEPTKVDGKPVTVIGQ